MLTHAQISKAIDPPAVRWQRRGRGVVQAVMRNLAKSRLGTRNIVSPGAQLRRGGRVSVKPRRGEVMLRDFKRKAAKTLELKSVNQEQTEEMLEAEDVLWVARIVW